MDVSTTRVKSGLEPGEGGHDVGQDPRYMSPAELVAIGHQPVSPLQALRSHCIECCCGSLSEVRWCTATRCPAWPFRMGTDPWRVPTPTEAQVLARRTNAARARAARKNSIPGKEKFAEEEEAGTSAHPEPVGAPHNTAGEVAIRPTNGTPTQVGGQLRSRIEAPADEGTSR
jgi:hypothetical protein